MTYAFNGNKSKADIYNKSEIDQIVGAKTNRRVIAAGEDIVYGFSSGSITGGMQKDSIYSVEINIAREGYIPIALVSILPNNSFAAINKFSLNASDARITLYSLADTPYDVTVDVTIVYLKAGILNQ